MICIQTAQKEYVNFGLRLNISIFSLFLRAYAKVIIHNIIIYHKNEKEDGINAFHSRARNSWCRVYIHFERTDIILRYRLQYIYIWNYRLQKRLTSNNLTYPAHSITISSHRASAALRESYVPVVKRRQTAKTRRSLPASGPRTDNCSHRPTDRRAELLACPTTCRTLQRHINGTQVSGDG
jgi:hypothetical protein